MKSLLLASIALFSLQSAAFAEEGANAPKDKAKLSREDVANDKALSENFDTIDSNKDGFLDKTEISSWRSQKKEATPAQ